MAASFAWYCLHGLVRISPPTAAALSCTSVSSSVNDETTTSSSASSALRTSTLSSSSRNSLSRQLVLACGQSPWAALGAAGIEFGKPRNAAKGYFSLERDQFKTKKDLQRFAEQQANQLIVTSPRFVKVFESDRDLDNLYTELVGGEDTACPLTKPSPSSD